LPEKVFKRIKTELNWEESLVKQNKNDSFLELEEAFPI
jgi:hypothetical protein